MSFNKNIDVGEKLSGLFVIRNIELKSKDAQFYLKMEISNSSGRIYATYWGEDSQKISKELRRGVVVKILGRGIDVKGSRWLQIDAIRLANKDEVSVKELLPKGHYSCETLWERFSNYIDEIENPNLKNLLKRIFDDDKEFLEKFINYPAAKLWHGAYVGGLIEHTLRVAKICSVVSSFYPNCRKDLLLTGALIHDIGKVDEITTDGFFDYGVNGRLLGHITLGVIKLKETVNEIEDFDEKLLTELLHLVISHHGEAEKGSPIPPKTLEAIILHHADMLDAQAEGIEHIIERDLPIRGEFSNYIRILERFIYLDGYRKNSK
jgi:3'-5' exoribonuclease